MGDVGDPGMKGEAGLLGEKGETGQEGASGERGERGLAGKIPYSGFFRSVKFSFCAKNMDFRQFNFRLLRAHMCTTPLRTRAGRAEKYSF